MAPGRAKKNGARLSTELDTIAIGVTTEKADEFVQLFLHTLGNKDIAVKPPRRRPTCTYSVEGGYGGVSTACWVAAGGACKYHKWMFMKAYVIQLCP